MPQFIPGRRLLLAAALALPLTAQVRFQHRSDRVAVDIDGKPFAEFVVGADATKPYLFPLRSASGKVVTRFFPMELVDGERRDHPHHRGLWFTHGDVNGVDFWSNEKGQKGAPKGRVVLRRLNGLKDGKKSGTLDASFEWQGPDGAAILAEARKMTFTSEPGVRIIDVDVTLAALVKTVFGDTKEGTFAIRLAPALEAPRGEMVNASGASGEKAVWGKRSQWVDVSGDVEGERLGVAVLDHPSNPRHPVYWHARGYGLLASNPFGVHDFEGDRTKDGSMTLQPGQTLRFRYRVIVHSGDAKSAGIAARFAAYAKMR